MEIIGLSFSLMFNVLWILIGACIILALFKPFVGLLAKLFAKVVNGVLGIFNSIKDEFKN